MKESYVEGLAAHDGPESCGIVREGGVEALTGVLIGQPLSRESKSFREPTRLTSWKATWKVTLSRVTFCPCAVRDPGMSIRSLFGNREISRLAEIGFTTDCWSASGRC